MAGTGFGERAGESGRDLSSRPRVEAGRGDDLWDADREVTPEELTDSLGGDGRLYDEPTYLSSLRSPLRERGR